MLTSVSQPRRDETENENRTYTPDFIEWLLSGLRVESFAPSRSVGTILDFACNSPDIAALMWPGSLTSAAWLELRNKLEAFRAFTSARRLTFGSTDTSEVWNCWAKSQNQHGDFLGLWKTEGLAYYLTLRERNRKPMVRGLISRHADQLPEGSLIPMHTGMGLAFASEELRQLSRREGGQEIRNCVVRYLHLCEKNSLDGYFSATFEALGLVVLLLRPGLLVAIDRQLADIDTDLQAALWHGVGRGLYFTPTNLLPCTSAAWPSLNRALRDPPHHLGRENAQAGLAWAVALVNVRNPVVMELFLKRHACRLPASDAFSKGVASAAVVWHLWSPNSNYLRNYCSHHPHSIDLELVASWERIARIHCRPEFLPWVEQLCLNHRIGDLFRVVAEAKDKVSIRNDQLANRRAYGVKK